MVKVIRPHEARDLGLPGRISREIISAETGANSINLRLVEIPVPADNDPPRNPHSHASCEECIYVLSGEGRIWTENGEHNVRAGDTMLIPPGEAHFTRNVGGEPLMLLCFFPATDVAADTDEPGVDGETAE